MSLRRTLCLVGLVGLVRGTVEGQPASAAALERVYTLADGLPGLRVRDIVARSATDVWVLTATGLAHFDGFLFSPQPTDGEIPVGLVDLPWATPRILVYGNATVGVMTPGGVVRRLAVPDSLNLGNAPPAAFGPDSVLVVRRWRLWLAGPDGTREVHGAFGLEGRRISRVWSTQRGSLWLLTDVGLLHWEAGRLRPILRWPDPSLGVASLSERPDGSVVFAVAEPRTVRGLWQWREGRTPERVADPDVAEVGRVVATPEREVVVQYFGAASERPAGTARFRPMAHAPIGRATAVAVSADGTVWVGGERGLAATVPGRAPLWTLRRFATGRLGNRIHEILRASDGRLWLATADGVVILGPDGREEWIRTAAGVDLRTVTGLVESPRGTIWVSSGGDFAGLVRFDGRRWHREMGGGQLDGIFGHRLRADPAGGFWILGLGRSSPFTFSASAAGDVFRVDRGAIRSFRPGGEGLEGRRVYETDLGPDGTRWFATSTGLSRFRRGRWDHLGRPEGLDAGAVYSLAVDEAGTVWFAHNRGRRVGRVAADDRVVYDALPASLSDAEVWSLHRGRDGRIWLGADGGVAVRTADGWVAFGSKDGMPSTSVWPVFEEGENVWIGSGDGLVRLDLARARAEPAPRVQVSARADGRRRVVVQWRVGTSRPDLDPAYVETRYRINAGPWSGWTIAREAVVSGLGRGQHRVEVQTRDLLGRAGPTAEAAVDLAGPPWQSPWVILVGLVIPGLVLVSGRATRRARRLAAEVRRREAAAYEAAYLEAPDGYVLERLPDRRIVAANPLARRLLLGDDGAGELPGRSTLSLVHPESRAALEAATAALLSERRPVLVTVRAASGAVHLELHSLLDRSAPDGAPTCRTILRDVSAREVARRELELYRRTLEASTEPVVWFDRGGVVHRANRAAGQLLGTDAAALTGTPLSALLAGPAVDALAAAWPVKELVAPLEGEVRRSDGTPVAVDLLAFPVASDGEPLAVLLLRDRRDVQRRTEEREGTLARMEDQRRTEGLDLLARVVAHEFNNTLAAIRGGVELLTSDAMPGSPSAQHAAALLAAAERGQELVSQVLAATGGRPEARERVRLADLVRDATSRLMPALSLGIRVEEDLASSAEVLLAPGLVRRAVDNLLQNALDALPPAGGTVAVSCTDVVLDATEAARAGVPPGPGVRVLVRDTGRGMTPEVLRRSSEPFFTTRPSQRVGLGLTVVRRAVADAGGAVRVESAPGAGTAVEVLFPAMPPAGAVPAGGHPVRPEVAAERRMLVVDDDRQVRRMTAMLLGRMGWQVVEADSVAAAEAVLRGPDQSLDAVITDLTMPEVGGLELIRRLRADGHRLPVIVVSGYADRVNREDLESLEVHAVLAKPFGRRELLAATSSLRLS